MNGGRVTLYLVKKGGWRIVPATTRNAVRIKLPHALEILRQKTPVEVVRGVLGYLGRMDAAEAAQLFGSTPYQQGCADLRNALVELIPDPTYRSEGGLALANVARLEKAGPAPAVVPPPPPVPKLLTLEELLFWRAGYEPKTGEALNGTAKGLAAREIQQRFAGVDLTPYLEEGVDPHLCIGALKAVKDSKPDKIGGISATDYLTRLFISETDEAVSAAAREALAAYGIEVARPADVEDTIGQIETLLTNLPAAVEGTSPLLEKARQQLSLIQEMLRSLADLSIPSAFIEVIEEEGVEKVSYKEELGELAEILAGLTERMRNLQEEISTAQTKRGELVTQQNTANKTLETTRQRLAEYEQLKATIEKRYIESKTILEAERAALEEKKARLAAGEVEPAYTAEETAEIERLTYFLSQVVEEEKASIETKLKAIRRVAVERETREIESRIAAIPTELDKAKETYLTALLEAKTDLLAIPTLTESIAQLTKELEAVTNELSQVDATIDELNRRLEGLQEEKQKARDRVSEIRAALAEQITLADQLLGNTTVEPPKKV